jgi:hypothetical protein
VLTGVTGNGRVWLNDEVLGEYAAMAEEIRFPMRLEQLQPRNRLRIELSWDGGDGPGGLYAPVAIEILSEMT